MKQEYRQIAIDYKKNVAGKFMLVEGAKLKQRIEGERLCVTRKIDGHMQCVFYDNGEVTILNSQGRQVAEHLPCLDIFAEEVKRAGIHQIIVAAELYLPTPDGGRPRCGDVQRALADETLRNQLCLAPFDIVSLDGEPWHAAHYSDTHGRLRSIFNLQSSDSSQVAPVEMRMASSHDEVQTIYDEWVENEGAEGLVVHSESTIVWKVKPRHTIDAAIIGYTTGDRGVRDLMMAVRREDGCFQLFAVGSGSLSDDDRATLADRLASMHVESQYVLSDSRGIAYQMVTPEIVYEVSVIELVARGNDDKVRTNPLLIYDDQQGWLHQGMTPGVSALGLTIERERKDKTVAASDIRVSQLTDLCPFEQNASACGPMEKSEMLTRRVFRKMSGSKVMLHKFVIWKTNKEATGRFPAYILYHTDYSSSRKEMIKRDMVYSSDKEQVYNMLELEIANNVKKGWEEI